MRTQVHHIVAETARTRGDSPALTFKAATLTYGQLWQEIVGVAAGLRRLGLDRGERVAVYLDKRIETVAALFGASAAGGVFVPVNPLLRPRQVGHILADCDVRVLVTTAARFALLGDELAGCKSVEHIVLLDCDPDGVPQATQQVTSWDDLRAAAEPGDRAEPAVLDVDVAAILYTSGSTGKPKGVVLSHRNLIAGGRMPRATLEKLRATFPAAKPFLMYGLTEAFRSTYLDPSEVDRRPDSIGKAIPNAEILVVRPDGSLCDPGEEGELVHRGALVALGYWNDPERTAERFRAAPGRESGLCTAEIAVWSGDVVLRDEDGFLYFVGRRDEMIKTSGYRVSPTEIEEVVYDTGLVRDAVAIGVPDARLGQQIVLVVTPARGGEVDTGALLGELRKQLPLYMVPGDVVVRPEIARSPNGKFDRNLLRQELSR